MARSNASEWKKIEDLFLAVADLPFPAPAEFLDGACPDPGVRAEVEALFAAEAAGRGSLTGAVRSAAAAMADDDLPGRQLGPWKVGELIGEGGIGSVYLGLKLGPGSAMRSPHRLRRPELAPLAWTDARGAYAQSLTEWKKLAGAVPSEAAIRIAYLKKKIAACDGALHAARD
ncbi:MAG: hypothetical protein JWN34_3391 [Bryobacterales bacterium]|jgi:hypothetical protein|nr:hypothetical protein [Bryobacterales bacterium]